MAINGLVTGEIGVGKTTVCQRVVDLVRERGFCVAGILTPALLGRDGTKIGIEIIDLSSGERRTLGRLGRQRKWLQVGRYTFDPEVLSWGCAALDRAAAVGCDLLVVDEVGPLELDRGLGFTRALNVLETDILPRSLIVVRDSLSSRVRQHAGDGQILDFYITKENRTQIAAEIANRLFLCAS